MTPTILEAKSLDQTEEVLPLLLRFLEARPAKSIRTETYETDEGTDGGGLPA